MLRSLLIAAAIVVTSLFTLSVQAQTPVMRHVFDIEARCGEALGLGTVHEGLRVMIPITGGTVSGEGIKGRILPGGADYQMVDTLRHRVSYEARYTIATSDSLLINVVNRGVSIPVEGRPDYFVTTPTFEAPLNSAYSWLNDRIFVCRPIGFCDGAITLRVWTVE